MTPPLMHLQFVREFSRLYRQLPEREQKIIMWRFGFDGDGIKSLNQIGRVLGVSNERVRQIEKRTLERMFENMPNYN